MRVYYGKVIHVHPLLVLYVGGPFLHIFEFMHIISDEHIHSLLIYVDRPLSPHVFKAIHFWAAAAAAAAAAADVDIDSDE